MSPQLTVLSVCDDATSWEKAGFDVLRLPDHGHPIVVIGPVAIECVGRDGGEDQGGRGITAWSFDADLGNQLGGSLDGIAIGAPRPSPRSAPAHPNGISGLDHVVVNTTNLVRTLSVFERVGVHARRTRHVELGEQSFDQTFLWMGTTICEVISTPGETGRGPASIWGLAMVAEDLDHTVSSLGDSISAARTAVQPGRRIASFRHQDLDISVPVAVMTPHIKRQL